MVAGAKLIPWLLVRVSRLRSRELFTLMVLTVAVAVAALSAVVFGASMALGAFLAGMVVGQSKVSHQAAADALPLRDAFSVLFFVSVGMLFDPQVLVAHPLLFLALLAVVLVAKPLGAIVLVFVTRHSVRTALAVAGGLAQIGEFSFILATEAQHLGLMDASLANLLVAVAVVSISLNPAFVSLWFRLERPLGRLRLLNRWLSGRTRARGPKAPLDQGEEARSNALVVGYGPVGREVVGRLLEKGYRPSVVEMNVDTVLELQALGMRALFGDATHSDILKEAGLGSMAYILLTLPDTGVNLRILQAIRSLGSEARVIVRARYLRDKEALEVAGADVVCVEEQEAASALAQTFLADHGD
jgi:CPA2 family monovalent cation:H+ antiporter-2